MTKQAVAIVRIDPETVRNALASAGDDRRVGANGERFRMGELGDATLVHLELGIDREPDELAARVRALLGDLLDAHEEARGVPVYPDSYALEADGWDAAIEELGEAADWVKVSAPAAMSNPMSEALRAFGVDESALGGQDDVLAAAMRAAQQMAESGALEQLAERMRESMGGVSPEDALRGGMGGLDLEALTQQAQRMLAENPELEEQLRDALGASDDEDE